MCYATRVWSLLEMFLLYLLGILPVLVADGLFCWQMFAYVNLVRISVALFHVDCGRLVRGSFQSQRKQVWSAGCTDVISKLAFASGTQDSH